MNITHIIRGDDHKINTFKQVQIFEAMGWLIPKLHKRSSFLRSTLPSNIL
jgi:glutamyl/glutaminyl-tRNA synthetase